MNIKSIVYLLFLIITQTFFGQDKNAENCDLENKNVEWKNSFINSTTKENKLILIREKIISDTIYREYKPKLTVQCGSSLSAEVINKNGINCGVKILFALNYTPKNSLTLDLNKNPEYLLILEKLNELNIEKIIPVFDKSAQSIYGIYAKSGVVILITKNNKLRKEIKSLIKQTKKHNTKKPNG
jgi:hypothetical protein